MSHYNVYHDYYICLCPQPRMTTLMLMVSIIVIMILFTDTDTNLNALIQYCVCYVHIIYKNIELEFTLV